MRINDSRLFGITNSVLHNSSCHVGSFNNQLFSSRFECSYSFQTSPAEQLLHTSYCAVRRAPANVLLLLMIVVSVTGTLRHCRLPDPNHTKAKAT
ncbi:hypothetical protein PILCRDRAFT_328435 [Piloderma croceum F 1598]|uniref:Uncharacterized protein n=1 Tax=Piloderma croceum (strain F 1598) TaxID=765440 RepID=A0A0C3C860_PILCF|nr:hypothetical protein PILCRDRAFT_328435 [Piloderma croceum F 1598]